MSPALVDSGLSANALLLRLRSPPNGQFSHFGFQSFGDSEVCKMSDNADGMSGNSSGGGVGGAGGYCFSAAPRSKAGGGVSVGGGGRGRLGKGRVKKVGLDRGVGAAKPPFGSGVGVRDWGFVSVENRSGNVVEGKGFDDFRSLKSDAVESGLSVERTDGVDASTSGSSFEFGSRLGASDNVAGSGWKYLVGDTKIEKQGLAFGSGRSSSDGVTAKLDDMNFWKGEDADSMDVRSLENESKVATLREELLLSSGIAVEADPVSPTLLSMPGMDLSGSQLPVFETRDGSQINAATEAFSVRPNATLFDGFGNSAFNFSSRRDETEFKSASTRTSIFHGTDHKLDFTAKGHVTKGTTSKKKKDKTKLNPLQTRRGHTGQDFPMREYTVSFFSPNLNPYPEFFPGNRISRESSLTSHESFDLGANSEQSDSRLSDSNDAVEEDLVSLTQQLGVNETGNRTEDIVSDDATVTCYPNDTGTELPVTDTTLRDETDAFNAATEIIDIAPESSTILAGVEVCSNSEMQNTKGMLDIAFTSSKKAIADPKFTFASSSSAPGYAAARLSKKKNRQKVGVDSLTVSPNANAYAASSSQFYQLSAGTSLLSSPNPMPKQELAYTRNTLVNGSRISNELVLKNESFSPAAVAAQESCENWRIRGNQAYANQDFSRAEEYYTNGLNSVSQAEKSKSCCRVLMLCYSNRAATRMALGRFREALEDCMLASAIDPSFLKVQLRAANCYLALGELDEATQYFKKVLMSKDVTEQKHLAEASDGIQKVQRVSQCMYQSAELLLQGAYPVADSVLQEVDEALSLSPYSEKLLEAKAEALFKLRNYEEVIKLSEQSLGPAEMNHPTLINDDQLPHPDTCVISKRYCFWLWRYHLIVKSCFQLGKLEQAVELLDKEASRKEFEILESLIPLAATIRGLVGRKVAGNIAFQSGKYEEAIGHYTAALANSLDSRSFAAICYCNRAAAYKAVNQIADAISDCSLAIALDQSCTKALSRRASLFEVIRDYDQAAKDLRRLLCILKKNIEEKKGLSGTSDRSTNLGFANDLREAEVRLSEMEGEARKETSLDLYLILGVEPLASTSDIRKAYRKCALKHHPDKAGQFMGKNDGRDDSLWKEMANDARRDTDRLFKMIGEAYAVLSDSSKRSRYDHEEEMRNAQKKGKGRSSTARTQTDFQNQAFERSSSGRQWTEVWSTYQQSKSQAHEASRSRRYT